MYTNYMRIKYRVMKSNKDKSKIPRKCQNHEAQPFPSIERKRDEEQTLTKTDVYIMCEFETTAMF